MWVVVRIYATSHESSDFNELEKVINKVDGRTDGRTYEQQTVAPPSFFERRDGATSMASDTIVSRP